MKMKNGFSFNGERKSFVSTIGKRRPYWAPITRNLLTIPKLPGARLMSSQVGVLVIPVEIDISSESPEELRTRSEELAKWLVLEEPAPLIFDDQLDRTYFAVIEGTFDPDEIATYGKGTITFICPDPYKYSEEKRIKINKSDLNSFHNIDVLGHKETYPVIRLDVAKQLNYFALKTDGDYLQIGAPEMIDETPYEPETVVFTDDMSTVVGWTSADNVDNGNITGNIASTGEWFWPETVGTTVQEGVWQGPSLKKAIGTALTDFRAQINLALFNTPAIRTGMIEMYFLNAANETVCKIGIEDRFAATNNVLAKAAVGGVANRYWIHSGGAGKSEWWDNFSGIMRIERKNNYWTVYFSTIDENGVHTRPRGVGGILNYNDLGGVYADEITQVQVSFRLMPGSEKADMRIHGITIWQLNEPPEPTTLPIVAYAGDVLEIDHYRNVVRRNGEIVQGLKDFASNFFPLKPGHNRLSLEPPDAGDLTVTYRERYL